MIHSILSLIGLAPKRHEYEIVEKLGSTYKTLKVIGRGTVTVSIVEVVNNKEFEHLHLIIDEIRMRINKLP